MLYLFQIKRVSFKDGSCLFCIWLSRDQDEEGEGLKQTGSQLWARSFDSTIDASSGNVQDVRSLISIYVELRINSTLLCKSPLVIRLLSTACILIFA